MLMTLRSVAVAAGLAAASVAVIAVPLGTPAHAADPASSVTSLIGKAAKAAVGQLGRKDGFWANELVRIALPGPLKDASKVTDALGLTKGLHRGLNSAAEGAIGKAGPLIDKAVGQMTLVDAAQILLGGEDAATQYFKRTMGPDLQTQIRPLMASALASTGAFKQLDRVNAQIGKVKVPKQLGALGLGNGALAPISPDGLTDYTTDKATDGLFLVMAQEEKKLRANPLGAAGSVLKGVLRNP
jgi:hypothetical protein